MANPNCTACGRKLSKPRLEASKRKCYRCEVAAKRGSKQKAHDRLVESEDFTSVDYWLIYEKQEGHCAIYTCRATGKTKYLAVEHDHSCQMGHDPKRWCRVCVRGLTCSVHNEWIGRAGDNPEVFDSLAHYLRNPPATEVLMANMIVGSYQETIATLVRQYRIKPTRAGKMLDMARGVGPSPTAAPNGTTIIIKYIRVPRTDKELYEIIETATRIDSQLALKQLMDEYHFSTARAKTALNSAWEKGKRRISTADGTIHITYHGRGTGKSHMFSIECDEA